MANAYLHLVSVIFLLMLYIIAIALPGLYYESITFHGHIRVNTSTVDAPLDDTLTLDLSLTAYHFSGVYTTARVAEHHSTLGNTKSATGNSIADELLPFLDRNWHTLVELAVDENTGIRDCLVYSDITVATLAIELADLVGIFVPDSYDALDTAVIVNSTLKARDNFVSSRGMLDIVEPNNQCIILCICSKVVAGIAVALLSVVVLISLINMFTSANFHERWYTYRIHVMFVILLTSALFIAFTETQFSKCTPYETLESTADTIKNATLDAMSTSCTDAGLTPSTCIEVGADNTPYMDFITRDTCNATQQTCAEFTDMYGKDRGAAQYVFWVAYLLCIAYTILLIYEMSTAPPTYTEINQKTDMRSFL